MVRKIMITFLNLICLLAIAIFVPNYIIKKNASNKVFDEVSLIKKNKVGLVLGTSKTLMNGQINYYYKYRVDAAFDLFKSGKIDFILVSGDNSHKDYDEPSDFKQDLIKKGVPENRIFLDYAGFRTLDSMVRAKAIFGQDNITVISQQFHNERAIYLAKKFGISAVGYNAKNVSMRYGFKIMLREYLARTKVFVDLLFNVQPKFYGKKIEIN